MPSGYATCRAAISMDLESARAIFSALTAIRIPGPFAARSTSAAMLPGAKVTTPFSDDLGKRPAAAACSGLGASRGSVMRLE